MMLFDLLTEENVVADHKAFSESILYCGGEGQSELGSHGIVHTFFSAL